MKKPNGLRLEAELCFVLGRTLYTPGDSPNQLLKNTRLCKYTFYISICKYILKKEFTYLNRFQNN